MIAVDEAKRAHLDWHLRSLTGPDRPPSVTEARLVGSSLVVSMCDVIHLAIVGSVEHAAMLCSPHPAARIALRMWQPSSADMVRTAVSSIVLEMEFLYETPQGESVVPRLLVQPGDHPGIWHPHSACETREPSFVCLGGDEYKPGRTTVADLVSAFERMLRFEPGTYSLDEDDAINVGAAKWLASESDFPLPLSVQAAPTTPVRPRIRRVSPVRQQREVEI